jgi:hypothetical protein
MGTLTGGHAGWLRWDASDCPPTFLRFLPGSRGRWLLRELVIDASESEPLTAAVLARIPVADIETYINGDKTMRETMESHLNVASACAGPATGSNVAVLASHYVTTYGTRADPAKDWCVAATMTLWGENVVKKRRPSTRYQLAVDAEYRLTSPPGPDGLSDEFLDQVRRAYVAATYRGEPPNKTLAVDVGHGAKHTRSVERWVYEARKRGIMPPARARGARG